MNFPRLAVAVCVSAFLTASLTAASSQTSQDTTGTNPPPTATNDTGSATGSTDVVDHVVMPLTGVSSTDPIAALQPALVVKIDNHPQARPQSGLNRADIVYEENVESLTRFAAVFHSQPADLVGPIRSARTQDVLLLGSYGSPLFAWSGGNRGVNRAVKNSALVDIGAPTKPGAYHRAKRRKGVSIEHTLYSSTAELRAAGPGFLPAAPAQFEYRHPGDLLIGLAAAGADVAMDSVDAGWRFDAATGRYLRLQNGKPHETTDDGQVSAENVVIIECDYRPSPASPISPEAQTVGSGRLVVLTAGRVVTGTWTRASAESTFQLVADDGEPVLLTPGRTWVELARVRTTTVVP